MKNKFLIWALFALWVPVAVLYGVINIIVRLLAHVAYRVNKGLWWLDKNMKRWPMPIARFFGDTVFLKSRQRREAKWEEQLRKEFDSVRRGE